MIIPVILSGGSGTRLWPLSRQGHPKQFLDLLTQRSLFQDTVERARSLIDGGSLQVICSEAHRFMVAEQLVEVGATATTILEPVGRNTAPALAVAAHHANAYAEDPLILVLPSDHLISDTSVFTEAVRAAAVHANKGYLVTFGIVPTRPETGYGYILGGDALDGTTAQRVEEFVEKPDRDAAQRYVDSGRYFWNSGMFLFKASRYLEELARHSPAILEAASTSLDKAIVDFDFIRLDRAAFEDCPAESIDYAVMEKAESVAVVPLETEWSDVGSWSAIWEVSDKDENGNVTVGSVAALNTCNSLIRSSGRLVSTLGVEDLIVVETPDAVLIANKDHVQDVKELVNQLRGDGRSEAEAHRKVYRPWGAYDSIDASERFQVKRITVKPGGCLSLQMHYHRAEHWVVVRGTAKVTKGDEVMLLTENQSTYIPPGVKHRLENPGKIPLDLIEVQSGAYLEEDDIVRFDDVYGRGHNVPQVE